MPGVSGGAGVDHRHGVRRVEWVFVGQSPPRWRGLSPNKAVTHIDVDNHYDIAADDHDCCAVPAWNVGRWVVPGVSGGAGVDHRHGVRRVEWVFVGQSPPRWRGLSPNKAVTHIDVDNHYDIDVDNHYDIAADDHDCRTGGVRRGAA